MYPLVLIAMGIFFCILVSTLSTHIMRVDVQERVESTLKFQLIISTVVLLGVTYLVAFLTFPANFKIDDHTDLGVWTPYVCSVFGLVSGMFIAAFTEYVTSHTYSPVR